MRGIEGVEVLGTGDAITLFTGFSVSAVEVSIGGLRGPKGEKGDPASISWNDIRDKPDLENEVNGGYF